MLEEPGAHDVGGLLGQNPALVLGGIFLVAEGVQVLMELQLELRAGTQRHTHYFKMEIALNLNSLHAAKKKTDKERITDALSVHLLLLRWCASSRVSASVGLHLVVLDSYRPGRDGLRH